jgi:hypothetical protein
MKRKATISVPIFQWMLGVRRDDTPPLRELRLVTCGHVLEVAGHLYDQVVLLHDLRVGSPELV